MESIVIEGGIPIVGNIVVSGSKNAALPLLAASLLTGQSIEICNVPNLSDIHTMKDLLSHHGSMISIEESEDKSLSIKLEASNIHTCQAPYNIVKRMRASIWVLGPLLARFGEAKIGLPGGCKIGERLIDQHIKVMESMGANVEIKDKYIIAKTTSNGLQGSVFAFEKISVGATINGILAATLANGTTVLSNCAIEPEIVDLCCCLTKMGAQIHGVGTKSITIHGQHKLTKSIKHKVLPDRIEAGTYMIAAAATLGELTLHGINYNMVEDLAIKMKEAGITINHGEDFIKVTHSGDIQSVDLSTQPYPGFSTDLQAPFMSLMALAHGKSSIAENIYESRFLHVPELCKMGAKITINHNNHAIVEGSKGAALHGAEVISSDLRASVSLIIAGLCAKGTTKVKDVYHLDRGYQALEDKLRQCGAKISRITKKVV